MTGKKKNGSENRSTGRASAVGIEFGMAVILCTLAGNWADERWETDPWLTLLGMVLGSMIGFRALWRIAKQSAD